jgi:hypothetical protein
MQESQITGCIVGLAVGDALGYPAEFRLRSQHIFVAFLSYCLQVTMQQRLKALAPGLTVRSVLEKFASIQLVDVYLPTTDGRELRLPGYTEPNKEHLLLLSRLNLKLPPQPRPELLDKKPKMTELKMHV